MWTFRRGASSATTPPRCCTSGATSGELTEEDRPRKRVCVKPTRKNRKRRKCTRYQRAGRTLVRQSKAGKNSSVKFSGRIGRKALKRGSYRLTIVATDAAGNKSKTKRLRFRVVRP